MDICRDTEEVHCGVQMNTGLQRYTGLFMQEISQHGSLARRVNARGKGYNTVLAGWRSEKVTHREMGPASY